MSAEKTAKERLDVLLVQRGLAPTREKAQAFILAGIVLVEDQPITKAGARISSLASVRLKGEVSAYVGRGGDKIASAFDKFSLSISDRIAVDIGASTGGFTDFLLQQGVSKVYAIDVGHSQLDQKIRRDERVVVMERVNARSLAKEMFAEKPSLAVIDVSFISLTKILEPVISILQNPFDVIALVKPQFEVGPGLVEEGGLVSNEKHRLDAVKTVTDFAVSLGLALRGQVPSGLLGKKSENQEYFIHLTKD